MNGLKYSIQDKLSLFNLETVHKCYHMALRIEVNFIRKGDQQGRGRGGNFRGKGRFGERGTSPKPQGESSNHESEGEPSHKGSFRGRRPNGQGRFGGRGANVFTGRCFTCNQVGHQSFRCPKK